MNNPYQSPSDIRDEESTPQPVPISPAERVRSSRRWIKHAILSACAFGVYLSLPYVFADHLARNLMGLVFFIFGMVFAALTAISQAEHYERFGRIDDDSEG